MRWNIEEGRDFFRQTELLLGRRGSKNYLGMLFMAWVLWRLISDEDPHERFGVDRSKVLTGLVFAGKKDHAYRNRVRDLVELITTAPAFRFSHPIAHGDGVVLFTPRQVGAGVDTRNPSKALIQIQASETTLTGARGPASFLLGFDEFAFLQGAGSTANSTDLYNSAYPSTTQFRGNAPILQTTSPWDRAGQAWETYKQGMAIHPDTGVARAPDVFVLQLPSWSLYDDHDVAHLLTMWPDGPRFPKGMQRSSRSTPCSRR